MEDGAAEGEEEADAADGNVREADEVVLAADPGRGGQDQRLLPLEDVRVVVVLDHHRDLVARHDVRLDSPVELPECWEGGGSHPDDEVLLLTQLKNKGKKGLSEIQDGRGNISMQDDCSEHSEQIEEAAAAPALHLPVVSH